MKHYVNVSTIGKNIPLKCELNQKMDKKKSYKSKVKNVNFEGNKRCILTCTHWACHNTLVQNDSQEDIPLQNKITVNIYLTVSVKSLETNLTVNFTKLSK